MRKLKQLFTWGFFFLAIFSVSAQNVQLSGTVKDEAGTPLLGVFIMIKGTQVTYHNHISFYGILITNTEIDIILTPYNRKCC